MARAGRGRSDHPAQAPRASRGAAAAVPWAQRDQPGARPHPGRPGRGGHGREPHGPGLCPGGSGMSPVRGTPHPLWTVCSGLGHCTGKKSYLVFRWNCGASFPSHVQTHNNQLAVSAWVGLNSFQLALKELHPVVQIIQDTYTNNLSSIYIIYSCTEQTLDTQPTLQPSPKPLGFLSIFFVCTKPTVKP